MKWFDNTALTLVIIGAVNWLLVGIFKFDLVAFSVRGICRGCHVSSTQSSVFVAFI